MLEVKPSIGMHYLLYSQRNSIKILSQLMEDFHLRSSLLKDEGLPLVMNLLESDYAIVQELALNTLRSCMHHGNYTVYTWLLLWACL